MGATPAPARTGQPTSLHDLRHTHATLLLRDGVPVKVVAERLGHAQASITMDVYAHVLGDMQEKAVDSIDAALFRYVTA
jgi:integrase